MSKALEADRRHAIQKDRMNILLLKNITSGCNYLGSLGNLANKKTDPPPPPPPQQTRKNVSK